MKMTDDIKQEKNLTRIGIVLIAFLLIVGGINNYRDYKKLLANPSITTGRVVSKKGFAGKRKMVRYEYKVGNSYYQNELSFYIFSSIPNLKAGRKFYVVYSLENPRLSTMIYELQIREEESDTQIIVEDILKHVQMLNVTLGWPKNN